MPYSNQVEAIDLMDPVLVPDSVVNHISTVLETIPEAIAETGNDVVSLVALVPNFQEEVLVKIKLPNSIVDVASVDLKISIPKGG